MSSQGTLAAVTGGFWHDLLRDWGRWAKSDGERLGYSSVDLIKKGGLGSLFSESDLLKADAAISSLPPYHKDIIIRIYLHNKPRGINDNDKAEAFAAFSEAIAGDNARE